MQRLRAVMRKIWGNGSADGGGQGVAAVTAAIKAGTVGKHVSSTLLGAIAPNGASVQ